MREWQLSNGILQIQGVRFDVAEGCGMAGWSDKSDRIDETLQFAPSTKARSPRIEVGTII